MSTGSQYVPLLTDDHELEELEGRPNEKPGLVSDPPRHLERRTFQFIIAACVASLACTLLNVTFLGLRPTLTSSTERLKYANSYVGLETAIRDPSSPPISPIMNYPVVLAQIDKSSPKKVFLDTHHLPSPFGTFYPEDRKFKVSKDVSTIAQFRIVDFGMERCHLIAYMPSPTVLHEINMTSPIQSSSSVDIAIYRLKAPDDLDLPTLSFSTRPERETLLTTWNLRLDQTLESESFDCPSRSMQSFEFACAEGSQNGCDLEFQQDPRETRLSFMIMQHQTV